MIVYLNGQLMELNPTSAVVECAGLGYFLKISLTTYDRLKSTTLPVPVLMHTFFQVREDAHTLYGFAEVTEKQMFELLLGVSGVGGNTALGILSSLSVAEIQRAISQQDTNTLKKIKGLGEKTVGRILLELKDRLPKGGELSTGGTSEKLTNTSLTNVRTEALAALIALGFSKTIAEKKIDSILSQHTAPLTVEQLIKLGLRS